MTKQEAIEAMKAGKKVTHKWFTDNEFMTSDERGLVFTLEDGVKCNSFEFWLYRSDDSWNNNWSIFDEDYRQVDTFK